MTSATETIRQRQQCSDYIYDVSSDQQNVEFRHRIGLLPDEEEDLSDAFKKRLGLTPGEEPNGVAEIAAPVASYDIERDATINKIKFDKFIKSFTTKTSHVFAKDPLTQPLLVKDNEVDRQASLVISNAIKRFCGDTPGPPSASKKTVANAVVSSVNVVISQLELLAKKANPEQPVLTKDGSSKRNSLKALFGGSGKQTVAGNNNGPYALDADVLSSIPTTEFELVQFITAYGILRRELRDEIYCQLCAQVTSNPSTGSCSKGWIMHALCAACFMPSDQLLKYYFGFLNDASSTEYSGTVTQIKHSIHRTNEKGSRFHPPNWMEYLAIKSQKAVVLPVMLTDERCETIEVDSATTAAEMCRQIAASIGLRDRFGFAIYISVYDKVSSLGQGSDHVMDAISECEQLVMSQAGVVKVEDAVGNAPWQLFYRKEIFTPWHDVEYDDAATDLIFRQIVQGVSSSEYRLRSEEEVARFVARRLYVEHGERLVPGLVQSTLHELLPKSVLSSGKSRELWTQSILAWFEQMGFTSKKYSRQEHVDGVLAACAQTLFALRTLRHHGLPDDAIKAVFQAVAVAKLSYATPAWWGFSSAADRGRIEAFLRRSVKRAIVESAKRKWPLHFSGLFEARCVHGPSLPRNDVVIAVSCRGVFFLEEPYKVIFGVHFYELVEVKHLSSVNGRGPGLTLITVTGEQWTFQSPNADVVARLMTAFLDGLRRRSRWAVAIDDFFLQDHTKQISSGRQGNLFELSRGDIVELLDETTQKSLKADWMYGRLVRTGACGAFPYDCVYIIPTCEKPPDDFLALFTDMSCSNVNKLPRKRGAIVLASQTIGRHAGDALQSAA